LPDMVVHICNPSIQEDEAEGLWVRSQPRLLWDSVSKYKTKKHKSLKFFGIIFSARVSFFTICSYITLWNIYQTLSQSKKIVNSHDNVRLLRKISFTKKRCSREFRSEELRWLQLSVFQAIKVSFISNVKYNCDYFAAWHIKLSLSQGFGCWLLTPIVHLGLNPKFLKWLKSPTQSCPSLILQFPVVPLSSSIKWRQSFEITSVSYLDLLGLFTQAIHL
jgi:hypothetical protein